MPLVNNRKYDPRTPNWAIQPWDPTAQTSWRTFLTISPSPGKSRREWQRRADRLLVPACFSDWLPGASKEWLWVWGSPRALYPLPEPPPPSPPPAHPLTHTPLLSHAVTRAQQACVGILVSIQVGYMRIFFTSVSIHVFAMDIYFSLCFFHTGELNHFLIYILEVYIFLNKI